MIKKTLFIAVTLLFTTLILSACSPSAKLSLDGQVDVGNSPVTSIDSPVDTPTLSPSQMSDEQLLLQMESESDASIDQEFARLEKELE